MSLYYSLLYDYLYNRSLIQIVTGMPVLSRKTPFILLVGDLVAFLGALWLTLLVRYGGLPSEDVFYGHFVPFSFLFIIWVVVYFISGLYERQTVVVNSRLSQYLIYAQLINIALAAIFFYFVTFTALTPKTNLIVYLIISSILILLWRLKIYQMISPERKQAALIIGSGSDLHELVQEVNSRGRYNFSFTQIYDLDKPQQVPDITDINTVVIDFYDKRTQAIMPQLYELLFSKVQFVDMHNVYEDVFEHVALSLLTHNWFLDNISVHKKHVYEILKRSMDLFIAIILGIISLVFYPFVWIAIKSEDRGPVFIMQERVGRDGKIIRIPKFRSMKSSDKGVWVTEGDNRITRVGKILRQTRIDELPQLWSVIKGDMSLVGPRPDIYDLGMKLSAEIPYYNLRNLIKPGLSGWAQIRQELPPQSLEETKMRLAYDFYYIKNRSLLLDLKIALQTIATLASRVGK